jgi:hypothetical protein
MGRHLFERFVHTHTFRITCWVAERDVAFSVQCVSEETDAIPHRCYDEEEIVIESVTVETVGEESSAEFEPSCPSKKETSLASKAAGSGKVDEFDGATLDRMSKAAIKSLHRQLANGTHDDNNADCDDARDQNAGSKDVDCEASWSFVSSEIQDGEDDDAREMARAVESIGSALFNSDNKLRST